MARLLICRINLRRDSRILKRQHDTRPDDFPAIKLSGVVTHARKEAIRRLKADTNLTDATNPFLPRCIGGLRLRSASRFLQKIKTPRIPLFLDGADDDS